MWDDDWNPVDDRTHAEQVQILKDLLGEPGKRALDIGAGDGRIARELLSLGHSVTAVESDPRAVEQLRAIDGVDVIHASMFEDFLPDGACFDCALLLGHTLLLVHEPEQAVALLRRLRAATSAGGLLVIDPDCEGTWRDIAEGNWQEGVSEDGQWQLVWGEGDNTVALRRGEQVDPDDWTIRPPDRVLRLWTLGELRLLASATGWAEVRQRGAGVITMVNPGDSVA